jgi:glycosyltransferase involved in cell wall biosynthesis
MSAPAVSHAQPQAAADLAAAPDGSPREPARGATWVVYASGIAWPGHRNRQHELARQLACTRRVLFLEPPGLAPSLSLTVDTVEPGLWRASPPVLLPLGRFLPLANRLNRIHAAWRIRRWLDARPAARLLLIDEDLGAPLIGRLGEVGRIYDAADLDWTFTRRWNRWHLRRELGRAVRAADLVLASSGPLAESLDIDGRRPNVVLNGCDPGHLRPESPAARFVEGIPTPRLGYVGVIGERAFDTSLVASVARLRPQWSFVLAGPASRRAARSLRELPNIHIVGPVPYESLASVLSALDVGLIPYRSEGLVRYVFPKKFNEYLAMGKPVVATPLPALEGLEGLHHRAATPPEFVAAVEAALAQAREPGFAARQRAHASANSWEVRGREVRALVDEFESART